MEDALEGIITREITRRRVPTSNKHTDEHVHVFVNKKIRKFGYTAMLNLNLIVLGHQYFVPFKAWQVLTPSSARLACLLLAFLCTSTSVSLMDQRDDIVVIHV